MNVLHGWALIAGLAALTLPVLIHWLTRPRPTLLPWSAIHLLREIAQQRASRHRVRDFVVLSLRVLAVGLLAFTFARPLMSDPPLVGDHQVGEATRVVILDASQSMGALERGVPRMERARSIAANYLKSQSGLNAGLVVASAHAESVFDVPSSNLAALREKLADQKVKPERLNVSAALTWAKELLVQGKGRLELVIVSDFQRTNWASANFGLLPEGTLIELESLGTAVPLDNIAIIGAKCRPAAQESSELQIDVEVVNHTPRARPVQVEVRLGERALRLEGACQPGVPTNLMGTLESPPPGWLTGTAKLLSEADALPADDLRWFTTEVRPPPVVALITRQPIVARELSSYFLDTALKLLQSSGDTTPRLLRIEPEKLDDERLTAADLIVVDHPGRFNAAQVKRLANLIRRGRSLLYVASESIDATNLVLLADAAGGDWNLPVEFAPAPSQQRRELFLASVQREQSPFTIFGDRWADYSTGLRFSSGLTSRKLPGGLTDDIRASYQDTSAALVVGSSGAGKVAVWNVDLGRSNIVGSNIFLPLLAEISEWLLLESGMTTVAPCGEPLAIYLPADAGLATELKPSAPVEQDQGVLSDESLGVMWRVPRMGVPGVYEVRKGDTPVLAVAAATPADESQLQSLPGEVINERLAACRMVHVRSAEQRLTTNDNRWTTFATICIACLLVELLALVAWRA